MAAPSIAFGAPDNSRLRHPSQSRPIDLAHLARAAADNKLSEADALQAFARQARTALRTLSRAADEAGAVRETARVLKDAAGQVGAFEVETVARALEEHSEDASLRARLVKAVIEAENFILRLSR